MVGWFSVLALVVLESAAATLLVRAAAVRWLDYLVMAIGTAALLRPTEHFVTGDVSRFLPGAIWSDGSDGKDQIVVASAASTILLAVVAAAIGLAAFKRAWATLVRRGDS
jgi:hypothetical protein